MLKICFELLDIPFTTIFVISEIDELLTMIGIMVSVTWEVLIVAVLAILASKYVQGYYQASTKEIIQINGTTKAPFMNFRVETSLGVVTIKTFNMADRFFKNYLNLVNTNATMFFHSNAAIKWLILMIGLLQNLTLFTVALLLVLLPKRICGHDIVIQSLLRKLASMAVEWRRRKGDWRRHFKEKMSQEQAHHHRKPWIRAWRLIRSAETRARSRSRSMIVEWRRRKGDWRCHFKEKMREEQAHHHRKPWILSGKSYRSDHCHFTHPTIFHDTTDLLAKRRRNRLIIPFQFQSIQERDKELMLASSISIEIPINGIFRRNSILAYFDDPQYRTQGSGITKYRTIGVKEFKTKYQIKVDQFFFIPEEVHILPESSSIMVRNNSIVEVDTLITLNIRSRVRGLVRLEKKKKD
ncbi:DNA-directed RNA polymerase subunit beta'' [Glycine soja]